MDEGEELELFVTAWRAELALSDETRDADALEARLRSECRELMGVGLSLDEALMVARHRLAAMASPLDSEMMPEGTDPVPSDAGARLWWHLPLALFLGLIAGVATRLMLSDGGQPGWLRAICLIPLGILALYLAVTAPSRDRLGLGVLGAGIAVSAAACVFYPADWSGQTTLLTMLHLPVFALVLVGIAHLGVRWRTLSAWMDWVRACGEAVIYYVLIALGGGVVLALVTAIFGAIGVATTTAFNEVIGWVFPVCAVGTLLVCGWLVQSRKSAIGTIAPVLSAIFTPVITIVLLSFLVVVAITSNPVDVDRDVLITFDGVLVLVEAIVLFTVSARPRAAGPRTLDWMQMVLIVSALIVDLLSLWAMWGRLAEYGASPNKLAALVLNILLFVHLTGALWGYGRIMRGARSSALQQWQSAALPVFAAWAGVVALVFPLVFSFR